MNTFIFGFEPLQTAKKRAIVLNSPASGFSNGMPSKNAYRFVLHPDGDDFGNEPLFAVEQQLRSGEWSQCAAWHFQTVWESDQDRLSIQGNHWHVAGIEDATLEARRYLPQ